MIVKRQEARVVLFFGVSFTHYANSVFVEILEIQAFADLFGKVWLLLLKNAEELGIRHGAQFFADTRQWNILKLVDLPKRAWWHGNDQDPFWQRVPFFEQS